MRHEYLLQQLSNFTPADAEEERHCAEIMTLLSQSTAPFSRAHFEPGHVTASCFIVDPATGRLLLHHHKRLDRWLQMGGHVEGDELPPQAALREGMEESGLEDLRLMRGSVLDVDVHAIPAGKGEPEHKHFDVRYVALTLAPERLSRDVKESNELAWFELGRAEELMGEPGSSRAIRKIRGLM